MKNLNKILLLSIILFSCKKETIAPTQPGPIQTRQVDVRYGVYLWFDTISNGQHTLYKSNLESGTQFIYRIDLLDQRHILVNGKDTIGIADNPQTMYHFCIWVYVNGKIKYKKESNSHSIDITI